jgi:hypothetical protein
MNEALVAYKTAVNEAMDILNCRKFDSTALVFALVKEHPVVFLDMFNKITSTPKVVAPKPVAFVKATAAPAVKPAKTRITLFPSYSKQEDEYIIQLAFDFKDKATIATMVNTKFHGSLKVRTAAAMNVQLHKLRKEGKLTDKPVMTYKKQAPFSEKELEFVLNQHTNGVKTLVIVEQCNKFFGQNRNAGTIYNKIASLTKKGK